MRFRLKSSLHALFLRFAQRNHSLLQFVAKAMVFRSSLGLIKIAEMCERRQFKLCLSVFIEIQKTSKLAKL